MADVIATDNLLTEVQRRTLEALMDIVIPADEARGMPARKPSISCLTSMSLLTRVLKKLKVSWTL